MQTLFDYAAALAARDESIAMAEDGVSLTTRDIAEAALVRVIARGVPFSTDDVVREVGEDEYARWDEPRFLGGLMQHYSKLGKIRADGFMQSAMRTNHGRITGGSRRGGYRRDRSDGHLPAHLLGGHGRRRDG